jgi:hypothetical protein
MDRTLRLKCQSKPSVSSSRPSLTFPLVFSSLSFCFFFAGRPPFPFFLLSPLFELDFIPALFLLHHELEVHYNPLLAICLLVSVRIAYR